MEEITSVVSHGRVTIPRARSSAPAMSNRRNSANCTWVKLRKPQRSGRDFRVCSHSDTLLDAIFRALQVLTVFAAEQKESGLLFEAVTQPKAEVARVAARMTQVTEMRRMAYQWI